MKKYGGGNIDLLLKAGEARYLMDDVEGRISQAELKELEKKIGKKIFERIIACGYIKHDGTIVSRMLRALPKQDKDGWAEVPGIFWSEYNLDEHKPKDQARIREIEKAIITVILRNCSGRKKINERYIHPAGLFNYDETGLNYQRYMGRGEHLSYFNFQVGNKYGAFTPRSFTDVLQDTSEHNKKSSAVYRELIRLGVLDEYGNILDKRKLKKLKEFKLEPEQYEAVEDLINSAQSVTYEMLKKNLKAERAAVEESLLKNMAGLNFDDFSSFLENLNKEEKNKFLTQYRNELINSRLEHENVKNRGILLMDKQQNIIILLSDSIHTSAAYYAYLLNLVHLELERKKIDFKEIRIAHAYYDSTDRSSRTARRIQPLVTAYLAFLKEGQP